MAEGFSSLLDDFGSNDFDDHSAESFARALRAKLKSIRTEDELNTSQAWKDAASPSLHTTSIHLDVPDTGLHSNISWRDHEVESPPSRYSPFRSNKHRTAATATTAGGIKGSSSTDLLGGAVSDLASHYDSQVDLLSRDLNDLRGKFAAQALQLEEKTERLQKTEREKMQTEVDREKAKEKISELEDNLLSLRTALDEARLGRTKAETAARTAEQDASFQKTRADGLVTTLETERRQREREQQLHKSEVSRLEASLSHGRSDTRQMADNAEAAERKLAECLMQCDDLEARLRGKEHELRETADSLESARRRLDALTQENEQLTVRNGELTGANEALGAKVSSLLSEKAALREESRQQASLVESADSRLQNLRDEMTRLTKTAEEKSLTEEQLRGEKRKSAELMRECDRLRVKLSERENESSSKISELRHALKEAQDIAERESATVSELRDKLAESEKNLISAEMRASAAEEVAARERVVCVEAREYADCAREEAASLKKTIASLRKQLAMEKKPEGTPNSKEIQTSPARHVSPQRRSPFDRHVANVVLSSPKTPRMRMDSEGDNEHSPVRKVKCVDVGISVGSPGVNSFYTIKPSQSPAKKEQEARMVSQLRSLSNDNDRLVNENKDIRERLHVSEDEVQSCYDKLRRMEAEVSKARASKEAAATDALNHVRRVAELETKLEQLRAENLAFRAYEKASSLLPTEKGGRGRSSGYDDGGDGDDDLYGGRWGSESEDDAEELERKRRELKSKELESDRRREKERNQVHEAKRRASELSKAYGEERDRRIRLQEKLASLKEERRNLKQSVTELRQDLSDLKAEKQSLSERVSEVEAEREAAFRRAEDSEKFARESRAEFSDMKRRLTRTSEDSESRRQTHTELLNRLQSLIDNNDVLLAKLAEVATERDSLQLQVSELQARIVLSSTATATAAPGTPKGLRSISTIPSASDATVSVGTPAESVCVPGRDGAGSSPGGAGRSGDGGMRIVVTPSSPVSGAASSPRRRGENEDDVAVWKVRTANAEAHAVALESELRCLRADLSDATALLREASRNAGSSADPGPVAVYPDGGSMTIPGVPPPQPTTSPARPKSAKPSTARGTTGTMSSLPKPAPRVASKVHTSSASASAKARPQSVSSTASRAGRVRTCDNKGSQHGGEDDAVSAMEQAAASVALAQVQKVAAERDELASRIKDLEKKSSDAAARCSRLRVQMNTMKAENLRLNKSLTMLQNKRPGVRLQESNPVPAAPKPEVSTSSPVEETLEPNSTPRAASPTATGIPTQVPDVEHTAGEISTGSRRASVISELNRRLSRSSDDLTATRKRLRDAEARRADVLTSLKEKESAIKRLEEELAQSRMVNIRLEDAVTALSMKLVQSQRHVESDSDQMMEPRATGGGTNTRACNVTSDRARDGFGDDNDDDNTDAQTEDSIGISVRAPTDGRPPSTFPPFSAAQSQISDNEARIRELESEIRPLQDALQRAVLARSEVEKKLRECEETLEYQMQKTADTAVFSSLVDAEASLKIENDRLVEEVAICKKQLEASRRSEAETLQLFQTENTQKKDLQDKIRQLQESLDERTRALNRLEQSFEETSYAPSGGSVHDGGSVKGSVVLRASDGGSNVGQSVMSESFQIQSDAPDAGRPPRPSLQAKISQLEEELNREREIADEETARADSESARADEACRRADEETHKADMATKKVNELLEELQRVKANNYYPEATEALRAERQKTAALLEELEACRKQARVEPSPSPIEGISCSDGTTVESASDDVDANVKELCDVLSAHEETLEAVLQQALAGKDADKIPKSSFESIVGSARTATSALRTCVCNVRKLTERLQCFGTLLGAIRKERISEWGALENEKEEWKQRAEIAEELQGEFEILEEERDSLEEEVLRLNKLLETTKDTYASHTETSHEDSDVARQLRAELEEAKSQAQQFKQHGREVLLEAERYKAERDRYRTERDKYRSLYEREKGATKKHQSQEDNST
eukprot:Rmarinus@m.18133